MQIKFKSKLWKHAFYFFCFAIVLILAIGIYETILGYSSVETVASRGSIIKNVRYTGPMIIIAGILTAILGYITLWYDGRKRNGS